jgi:hypothetical protein
MKTKTILSLFMSVALLVLPAGSRAETATPAIRLINISSRAYVDAGNNVLIAGFVVSGSEGQKQVLLRGVGPGLGKLGVPGALKAAKIELHTNDSNGKDVVLMTNVQWDAIPSDGIAVNNAGGQVGAFPLTAGSKDAARVIFLFPGSYTVILSAADGTPGIGLVEVYEL